MAKTNDKLRMHHWQLVTVFLVAYDLAAVIFSYFIALFLRFDCRYSAIPHDYLTGYYKSIIVYAIIVAVVFQCFRLYQSIWRFASFVELCRLLMATAITSIIYVLFETICIERMPVSYFIFGIVFQLLLTVGVRFSYRFILLLREKNYFLANKSKSEESRVMLIGAGQAGQAIIRDVRRSQSLNDKIVCIIDDNSNKWSRFIDGVPVVGGRNSIVENCKKYDVDKIYYAIPSASMKTEKEILEICSETGCKMKKLPGMFQLISDQVTIADMKDVQIEDLLGREPIKVDMNKIFSYIRGKVILVTGGGGSIGSELCRQIAAHEPKKLIIFDIYENNAYSIQLELKRKYPNLKLETIIGSVRDGKKLLDLMEKYHPQIVYHAAAHKHVPLMEDSPCESIKNNVMGTYNTALCAALTGCERFVLISTDKAVNPTNIMGASKRLCEMVIQSFDALVKSGKADKLLPMFLSWARIEDTEGLAERLKKAKVEYVAVRFGNVLGSNGSVIPLFKKQIELGGPVTVTHPNIIRYFMTIPEAVSLVLQAGTYANGGEIFVLDMGEPVKIDTLARNLIRLSGHEPDVDIKIVYTGLRPGEKLFEEKLMAEEGLKKTKNELIHIGCPIPFDTDEFVGQLESLSQAAYDNAENIRELVEEIVTTYKPENI